MPATVTREKFQTREQEIEGEKLVTRHILERTRRNGDDIAAVKTRLNRVEEKMDGLDHKVDGLDRKLDVLTKNLLGIVGDALSNYEIKKKKIEALRRRARTRLREPRTSCRPTSCVPLE